MDKDEALKLALEVLEQLQGGCTDHDDGTVEAITVWCPEVIDAIKAALAQPAQEPVAYEYFKDWMVKEMPPMTTIGNPEWWAKRIYDRFIYTAPPQRTWVGLTDELQAALWDASRAALPRFHTYATLIEKELRILNT